MMQWFVRAAEWSVLLPVWREATQMQWLRVVAASGVGFVWFIVVMGAIGIATGAGSDDTPKYPAGSLTITKPADGATVDTKEIVIRGTAPPGAEVRLNVSRGRDKHWNAGADGKWEYRTELDEGDNDFDFFLQDAKDVRAKLTIKYVPPVVAEPTESPSSEPTEAPTAQPTTTAAPTVEPTQPPAPTAAPITYDIAQREDISIGPCIRIQYRVRVSGPLTEPELRRIAQEIIDDETGNNDVNAIGFGFYLPGTDTTSYYTAGKADWAPDGVWSKACDVETGDYSTHELGAIDTNGALE